MANGARNLALVEPEISNSLTPYLQPGQYPEPSTGLSKVVPNTNADVVTDIINILQAFTYWLIIAKIMCEYSFVGRLAKKHGNLGSGVLQFSSSPMKIEYSDGEIWYYDFTSLIFNEICRFIPVEHNFTVETDRISVKLGHERKDTVYTMWIKINFPKENTGYARFNILNKMGEEVADDGSFSFTTENLFIRVKLVLKKIDSYYQKDDIYFRMPELLLDFEYAKISAQVAHDPKFKMEDGDSSTPKPNIYQTLEDFFAQQLDSIPQRKTLAERISQNLLNQIGIEIMKAKSVSQCLCIFSEALTQRPANFENCSELMSNLATEVFLLVNDEKIREFITNFFKNSIPQGNSIFIFNRAFYSNEYATIDSIMKFPRAGERKSTLRSFLMDEKMSMLKLLDETVNSLG